MPRIVQEALRTGREHCQVPQWSNLRWTVTAWIVCHVAKVCQLAVAVGGRHRTSIAKFLVSAGWDVEAVLRAVTLDILRWMKPQAGEVLSLIIDDTRIAKRGKKMQAISKIWDHVEQRFVNGHIVVHAAILFRGVTLPWSFELWLPEKYCRSEKLPFHKLTQIAAKMIHDFPPPQGLKVRVLFDAFYLCPCVTKACQDRQFTWFSVASKNRLLTRTGQGKSGKIGGLAPGVLKHQNRSVRMKRDRGWRWLRIASIDGSLQKIGTVRIVFSKRPGDPWRNVVAIVTNETNLAAREIVSIYERRWAIEVLFKELKGTFGLGRYQMLSRVGLVRHMHLAALAHLTLTRHSLTAVGAQAKQPHKDVPLPKFQARLDTLRADIQRQNVERLVQRVQHAKLRQRLRKLLITA
jgi:SRSO17 transposase